MNIWFFYDHYNFPLQKSSEKLKKTIQQAKYGMSRKMSKTDFIFYLF